jgi:hypothetical protein
MVNGVRDGGGRKKTCFDGSFDGRAQLDTGGIMQSIKLRVNKRPLGEGNKGRNRRVGP